MVENAISVNEHKFGGTSQIDISEDEQGIEIPQTFDINKERIHIERHSFLQKQEDQINKMRNDCTGLRQSFS